MMFIYEMCPHCKDQLYERKQPTEDMDSANFCPGCGKKMVMACYGEQKIDNTVYKIILNDASVSDYNDKKNSFLLLLMKIGNISQDTALERYKTKDCVIFEGNISATYVNMHMLDAFTPGIHYTVIPSFPLERLMEPFISLCPVCGSEIIHKTEETDTPPDCVKDGMFCGKCNDWTMYTILNKSQIDETLYHLKVSLKGVNDKIRMEILGMADELQDKEVMEEQITVRDLAKNIENLLGIMKTYGIEYEINPSYPHKIIMFKEEWTEDDIKQLRAVNPGLAVSVEEMNSINR